MLFVAAIFIPPFTVAWTYLTFKLGQLQEIPSGVLELLLTIVGAKVAQSWGEVAKTYFETRGARRSTVERSAEDGLPNLGDSRKTVERPAEARPPACIAPRSD
jgi:hypothetical protein